MEPMERGKRRESDGSWGENWKRRLGTGDALTRSKLPAPENITTLRTCGDLSVVVRIQADVFGREVCRPEPGGGAAFFEDQNDARVAVGGKRFGGCQSV